MADAFDFAAFRRADEAKDVEPWLGFYAEGAVWIEYRHKDPPSRPNRMEGRAAIGAFLRQVATWPITLRIEDGFVAGDRAAFRSWVGLPDGRRIVEHAMLELSGGKVLRQVEVEAWD